MALGTKLQMVRGSGVVVGVGNGVYSQGVYAHYLSLFVLHFLKGVGRGF